VRSFVKFVKLRIGSNSHHFSRPSRFGAKFRQPAIFPNQFFTQKKAIFQTKHIGYNPFRANSGYQVEQNNFYTNDTCYDSLSPQSQRTSAPLIGNSTMSTFDPLLESQSYHQVSQQPQSGQHSAQQHSTAQLTSINYMQQALFSPISTGTNPSLHGYNFAGNSYTQTEFGQGFVPSTQLTQQSYQQVNQI
jgi:hypothetical protein